MAQEPAPSPSSSEGKKPRSVRRERSGEGQDKPSKRKKRGPKKAGATAGGAPPTGAGPTGTSGGGKSPKKHAGSPTLRDRWDDFLKYLRSVRAEMKRVTWPTKKEVQVGTVVVLITLVVVTGFIALINQVLTFVSNWI